MKASSWIFTKNLSKTISFKTWLFGLFRMGPTETREIMGLQAIGKRCFRGQITFGSKHVKDYLIELNSSSPNTQKLVLQTCSIWSSWRCIIAQWNIRVHLALDPSMQARMVPVLFGPSLLCSSFNFSVFVLSEITLWDKWNPGSILNLFLR